MTTQSLTTTKHIESIKHFIQDLELAVPQRLNRQQLEQNLKIQDGKESGFVDQGSLISFVAGISANKQADVLNSCLLAQLAANKKFDHEKDTENWYKFYADVLQNVGWVIQEFQFDKYNAAGATFSINEVVLEILAGIALQSEIAVVSATLKALKNLSENDHRFVIFDQSTHSTSQGNFQLSSVIEAGNVVAMNLGAFYFSTTQTVTKFLWEDFSSSNMSFYKSNQAVTLDENIYSQVRQSIEDKLGANAKTFVSNLDI